MRVAKAVTTDGNINVEFTGTPALAARMRICVSSFSASYDPEGITQPHVRGVDFGDFAWTCPDELQYHLTDGAGRIAAVVLARVLTINEAYQAWSARHSETVEV